MVVEQWQSMVFGSANLWQLFALQSSFAWTRLGHVFIPFSQFSYLPGIIAETY